MSTIERRDFLRGCAFALGAQALGAAPDSPDKPFTLVAHASMFRRFRGAELYRQVRAAGYRHIELAGGQIRAAASSEEAADRLSAELRDAGLTAVSAFVVHRIASGDDAERSKALAQWRRSIEGVRRLGINHIGTELTGNVAKPEAGEAAFRRSMDVLLPVLEDAGIHLSVEPHPGDFFEAAQPTLEMVRSYQSKSLSYLHCTPHTFYLGETIRGVIEEAGDLLTYVHIADTFRTERIMDRFGGGVGLHLHLRPGLGEVDFREVFDSLEKIGYRGYVSLQALSHNDRPVETARQSRRYLEDLLGSRLTEAH